MDALELQQARAVTAGTSPAPGASVDDPSSTHGTPDAAKAKAKAATLQQQLDRKNMSLAKAEEKCLVLEARQEDFTHLMQGFREEKVGACGCLALLRWSGRLDILARPGWWLGGGGGGGRCETSVLVEAHFLYFGA